MIDAGSGDALLLLVLGAMAAGAGLGVSLAVLILRVILPRLERWWDDWQEIRRRRAQAREWSRYHGKGPHGD